MKVLFFFGIKIDLHLYDVTMVLSQKSFGWSDGALECLQVVLERNWRGTQSARRGKDRVMEGVQAWVTGAMEMGYSALQRVQSL